MGNNLSFKRYSKNKKQKQILIGSIVGILLIIGGISLYRTFALYKEEKTFNMLKGIVPDFSIYKEPLLNGADPVLPEDGELIPVEIDEKGTVTKADLKEDWYKYEEKRWANAIIPTSGEKDTVAALEAGQTINENQIESYFVWIPKYSYKLFDENLGNYTKLEASVIDKGPETAIEIQFGTDDTVDIRDKSYTNQDVLNADVQDKSTLNTIFKNEEQCKTPMKSGESGTCRKEDWMTHPAFLAFNTTGLWIGKFEASKNNNNIQIKPNVPSWNNIILGDMFKNSLGYKKDLQSHMMKNTEWGAIAYLTQSLYGRCNKQEDGTTTCSEVVINYSYTTGTSDTNKSYFNDSTASSTTENYSGVYDMSGGTCDCVAGVMFDEQGLKPLYSESGLKDGDLVDSRYYDRYNYGTSNLNYTGRILGDATGEMGPFTDFGLWGNGKSSMWSDLGTFIYKDYPWFYRGGAADRRDGRGIFYFGPLSGLGHQWHGFRVVLAF